MSESARSKYDSSHYSNRVVIVYLNYNWLLNFICDNTVKSLKYDLRAFIYSLKLFLGTMPHRPPNLHAKFYLVDFHYVSCPLHSLACFTSYTPLTMTFLQSRFQNQGELRDFGTVLLQIHTLPIALSGLTSGWSIFPCSDASTNTLKSISHSFILTWLPLKWLLHLISDS